MNVVVCEEPKRQAIGVYRGRFAPTPSGPLHLGSLLTAVASWLQARSAGGVWLLRIDDLDRQRSRGDHAQTILEQLAAHGLNWDEPVRWQSQHVDEYEQSFETLRERAAGYPCACTPARLAAASMPGIDGPVYAGTCRNASIPDGNGAWRVSTRPGTLDFYDPWQGAIQRDLSTQIGDFVVRKADGMIGYQLACVVDEVAQKVTEVVRGADLIGSTLRQKYLQPLLGLSSPDYRHVPVLLDRNGKKLSKQNHAKPIRNENAAANLQQCLQMLGQVPPRTLGVSADEILNWAIVNWNPSRIPRLLELPHAV